MIRRRQVKHVRQYLSSSKIRKKRQKRRMLKVGLFIVACISLSTAFIYINRLPMLQMKSTVISGNILVPTETIEQTVQQYLDARKVIFGIIPQTNSFFIPERGIEEVILNQISRIEDVGVKISFRGVLTISVAEKTMRSVWCTDPVKSLCYDMDFEGNLFERTQVATEAPYMYTGIMPEIAGSATSSSTPSSPSTLAGKNFMSAPLLEKSEAFIRYLTGAGFIPQYIDCNTELTCIAYVRTGTSTDSEAKIGARSRIVYDVQSDLNLVAERLTVAFGGEALKGKKFAYIDTRFGNKLFYKYNESDAAEDDVLEDGDGDGDSSKPTSTTTTSTSSEE